MPIRVVGEVFSRGDESMNSHVVHISARLLIWLAAISVPVQGLPAWSCACSAGSNQACDEGEPQQACCCGDRDSCCGRGQACKCGSGCQCGKPKQPQPAAPAPVDDSRPLEKLLADAEIVTSGTIAVVSEPPSLTEWSHGSDRAHAAAALDRCISLCRFTI